MIEVITTTVTYHPNMGYVDTNSVTVKEFADQTSARNFVDSSYKRFVGCEEEFEGEMFPLGSIEKSPNSASADDQGSGVAKRWFIKKSPSKSAWIIDCVKDPSDDVADVTQVGKSYPTYELARTAFGKLMRKIKANWDGLCCVYTHTGESGDTLYVVREIKLP